MLKIRIEGARFCSALRMFLFCSARVSGHPCFKGMRCIVLFRFMGYDATKRELARFCSALMHHIVYFTSKQRSSSGTTFQKVPNLFRARVESAIHTAFQTHQGALICSAFRIVSSASRHNFVDFLLKSSFFVPLFVWMAFKKKESA